MAVTDATRQSDPRTRTGQEGRRSSAPGGSPSEPSQLDHAWFTGDAAKANVYEPMNQIYASSWKRTAIRFPLVWDLGIDWVSAVEVTGRYAPAAQP